MVTALYDIGRGNWSQWNRPFDTYLNYFSNVLKLSTNLIVFCERSTKRTLQERYGDLLSFTHFIIQPFRELEFYSYKQAINHVMTSDVFRENNAILLQPEGFSQEYIILMNNKLSFMKHAINKNVFNSTHFFWIDAGYGHGNEVIFPEIQGWVPRKLLPIKNKVSFIQLSDPEYFRKYGDKLHKQALDPSFTGGFFGGRIRPITELYHLYNKVFRSLLLEDVVDDDQNVNLFCYYELPRLFNLVEGDWFQAFQLFG